MRTYSSDVFEGFEKSRTHSAPNTIVGPSFLSASLALDHSLCNLIGRLTDDRQRDRMGTFPSVYVYIAHRQIFTVSESAAVGCPFYLDVHRRWKALFDCLATVYGVLYTGEFPGHVGGTPR